MFDAICVREPNSDNITKTICDCAELVKPSLNFHDLYVHVANGLASYADPRDYACTYAGRLRPERKSARQQLGFAMITHLEAAIANLLLSYRLEKDPYRAYALDHCIEFAHLHSERKLVDEAIRLARIRGGRARQLKLESVRTLAAERAREILRTDPTLTDWDVARMIESEVIAFVQKHKLAVVCAENLLRTIVVWIRRSRQAAFPFQQAR